MTSKPEFLLDDSELKAFQGNAYDQSNFIDWYTNASEKEKVDWLIQLFNTVFKEKNTLLVRSADEPEYFAPVISENKVVTPAKIAFAHGFFASALHEISHWCIAGKKRRLLNDFGYWYEPDGRSAEQQKLFEQVEVKPQAIEWLFTKACSRKFRVSVDNLSGEVSDSSHFKKNVHTQVVAYLSGEAKLPSDAVTWIHALCEYCRAGKELSVDEFVLSDL